MAEEQIDGQKTIVEKNIEAESKAKEEVKAQEETSNLTKLHPDTIAALVVALKTGSESPEDAVKKDAEALGVVNKEPESKTEDVNKQLNQADPATMTDYEYFKSKTASDEELKAISPVLHEQFFEQARESTMKLLQSKTITTHAAHDILTEMMKSNVANYRSAEQELIKVKDENTYANQGYVHKAYGDYSDRVLDGFKTFMGNLGMTPDQVLDMPHRVFTKNLEAFMNTAMPALPKTSTEFFKMADYNNNLGKQEEAHHLKREMDDMGLFKDKSVH